MQIHRRQVLVFCSHCQLVSILFFFLLLLSKPFPIGDRVTFSGKDCMCQQCSHTLVKSNEPIKIHGPSRKFGACLTLSICVKATGWVCQRPFVSCTKVVHLCNQVSVRSVVGPVSCVVLICQHKYLISQSVTVSREHLSHWPLCYLLCINCTHFSGFKSICEPFVRCGL